MAMVAGWARIMDRWMRPVSQVLAGIGAVALLMMMVLVSFDVFGRFLFNRSIVGAYEIVQYLMVIAVFLSFAYGQFDKSHIAIDIVVSRLSPKARARVNVLNYLIMLAIVALIVWGDWAGTEKVFIRQETSGVLLIPRWPFQLISVVGAAAFCLAAVVDFLKSIAEATE